MSEYEFADCDWSCPELAEVLESALASLEDGVPIDLVGLKERYPELASQIDLCVGNLQFIEGASHLLDSSPSTTDQRVDGRLPPFDEIGDFRLHRQIGRGGMGVVYEAEQISLGRRVALKILPLAALIDERAIRRFQNEVTAAASLEHPHIVDVYAVACDKGVHHYAMRLIRGRTVARIVQQLAELDESQRWKSGLSSFKYENTSVPPKESNEDSGNKSSNSTRRDYYCAVARLGISIAGALHYAHENGVIHRDVKPSNLLVDENGKAWITDFGLAQVTGGTRLTMTCDVLGTLRYMSPEQATGNFAVDARTDVYALGATLYELLTLHPAFDAEDRSPLLQQVIQSQPASPRKLDRRIPRDLESVVLKAMERHRGDRYQTAQHFAEDLQRFVDGLPTKARPPAMGRRLMKWGRRHPTLTISVTAMMLIIASAFAIVSERQARIREQEIRELQQVALNSMEFIERNQKYTTEIRQAFHCWNSSRVHEMRQHLSNCLPSSEQSDLRGFEWYYLDALINSIPTPIGQHDTESYFVEFAPDDMHVVSAGDDGIRIWNADTRKQTAHLMGAPTQWIDFSEDGSWMATASFNKVLFWDTVTWQIVREFECEQIALGAEFVPSSNTIAIVEREEGPESLDSMVSLFDVATGEVIWKHLERNNKAESVCVSAVEGLVAVAYSAGDVHLMRLADGSIVDSVRIPGGTSAVATSADGKYLAVGSGGGMVSLWSFDSSFEKRAEFQACDGGVTSLHFRFNDVFLIAASGDGTVTRLRTILKDSAVGILLDRKYRYGAPLWCARFGHQGRCLATSDRDGNISIRDTWANDIQNAADLNGFRFESFSAEEKLKFARGSSHYDCSPDGRFVVRHDFAQSLQIRDSQTDELVATITVEDIRGAGVDVSADSIISRCQYIPQSESIAVKVDKSIIIVDSNLRCSSWLHPRHEQEDSFPLFHPHGHIAAVIEDMRGERRVVIRQTDTGEEIAKVQGNVTPVLWLPESNALLCSDWSGAFLLDAETWQAKGFLEAYAPMNASQDGRTLVSSADDELVLWNRVTLRELLRIPNPNPPPFSHSPPSLCFSDGDRSLTAEYRPGIDWCAQMVWSIGDLDRSNKTSALPR